MKVLHLHDAPHIQGGASAYLRRLVAWLPTRSHESALFSLDQSPGLVPEEACFRYQWPASALRRRRDFSRHHPPLARALEDFLARSRPDLVHVQNLVPFRTTVFPVLEASGLPVLMTVHDFGLLDPNPTGLPRRGLRGVLVRAMDRARTRRGFAAACRAVRLFLCPTASLQAGLPFPEGRSRLLRLPVDPRPAEPLPSRPLRIFFAGTLYRSKAVDVLLEALARADGPARVATLEIAGAGDQEEDLRRLARDLGLEDRVRFRGILGPADMDAAYRAAHVQALPSRVPENSPLTVLEAGAWGRPAVVSGLGGSAELVAPPSRGWAVPPEDPVALAVALEEAAGSLEEVAARGARMREWVRAECDPRRHLEALEGVYRELTE